MCAALGRRKLLVVEHPTITITLTLHRDDDCLEAVIDDGRGPCRPVHGWIGLMGAIETLLDAAGGMPAPTGSERNLS